MIRPGDKINVVREVEVVGEVENRCGVPHVDVLLWDRLELSSEVVERLEWTAWWDMSTRTWKLCNP